MTTNEFYFLMLVCAAFAGFGLALAGNYLSYRRWMKSSASRR